MGRENAFLDSFDACFEKNALGTATLQSVRKAFPTFSKLFNRAKPNKPKWYDVRGQVDRYRAAANSPGFKAKKWIGRGLLGAGVVGYGGHKAMQAISGAPRQQRQDYAPM